MPLTCERYDEGSGRVRTIFIIHMDLIYGGALRYSRDCVDDVE
jgi:hypothetical protein